MTEQLLEPFNHDASPVPVLEVADLMVQFNTPDRVVHAVNGISYHVDAGESLAILGESGSGKSVAAQAVMGILDSPPGFVTGGQVLFHGQDLLKMTEAEQRDIRGPGIAMIFQDALSALNPVLTVGYQIGEVFCEHLGLSMREAKIRAADLMDRVQIPGAKQRVNDYPHQFSGGMRQRVMIAMALALDPKVLIADEPTTALDVTVQAQILDLLKELQSESGMGLLLITHDLGVVNEVADRVAVMYAGKIVESGPTDHVFLNPAHPYTEGLMNSIPALESKGTRLQPIQGNPPDLADIPAGCAFHDRCPKAIVGAAAEQVLDCGVKAPVLLEATRGRKVACHHNNKITTGVGYDLS